MTRVDLHTLTTTITAKATIPANNATANASPPVPPTTTTGAHSPNTEVRPIAGKGNA
jgi:hypothetical protein